MPARTFHKNCIVNPA